jgi:YfiH family protein
MTHWHWQTWQDRPYITCHLLQDFSHGFFTQQFAPTPPETLVNVLHDRAAVYRLKQVHGNTVLTPSEVQQFQEEIAAVQPSEEPEAKMRPEADGLLTDGAEQAIWVCTADCVPALVGDVATGQVAAVHAGWRGTALKILPEAIARLQSQGSQLENLRVALGPAIAGEVYQVSTTVAVEVGSTILPDLSQAAEPDTVLGTLKQLPNSPVLEDPQPGRARLDVRRVNTLQLEQLGFHPEQIAIAPYCTYQNPEQFFSYRRDRQKNVQWSGIVSGS